ncbi:MAG: hypothetical protein U0894_18485 [Pirellulales bacterium]
MSPEEMSDWEEGLPQDAWEDQVERSETWSSHASPPTGVPQGAAADEDYGEEEIWEEALEERPWRKKGKQF